MTGNVLVTGYGGFIGQHLCRRLLAKGYSVVGADLQDAKIEGVRHTKIDITDPASFKSLPEDNDCVIHLAAVSSIPNASADYLKAYDINVAGTYNILKYFAKSGAKQFIFASSSKVYGPPKYLPVDEKHPLSPDNTYGRSKKAAEDLVEAFSKENKVSFTILRQFNIYGPGQSSNFFIPTVLNQLHAGDELKLGDLNVKRDFLYIDDLVDAYLTILTEGKMGLSTYNIGGGKSIPLDDVVKSAAKLYGRKPNIAVDPVRVRAEVKDIRSDNRKIRELGWQPKTPLEEGLRKIKESMF